MKILELPEYRCRIREKGKDGPIIIWFTSDKIGESGEKLWVELNQLLLPEQNFILAAQSVEDWNADLSPWKMTVADGTCFPGKGAETLNRMKTGLLPELTERYPSSKTIYTAGYSLAGLFALWGLYETPALSGAACCSGSLWYEGWLDYIQSAEMPEYSRVYLSLGGKESGTGPEWMREIGTAYEMQEKLLKQDKRVGAVLYEKNRGGHFANPEKRLAKGMKWLLESSSE